MSTILSYLRRSTRPAKPAFDKPRVWRIVPVLLVCLLAIVCGTLLQSPDRRAASADRPPGNLSARSEILATRADSDVRKPAKTGVPQIDYANLPLFFEPNVGQSDTAVRYLARGAGYGIFLASDGVTIMLVGGEPSKAGSGTGFSLWPQLPGTPAKAGATVAMKFVGANPSPHLSGLDPLPGKSNYFVGDDSSRWQTGLTQYERVRYEELYDGIDAIFYGKQRELEYDLVVSPQADPAAVTLHFEGAASLHLDTGGDLLLETPLGEVRQRRPVAYQEFHGERRPVDASFRLQGRRVTFDIGPYDRSRPLVIDPEIAYQRTIGGSGSDSASGIAVDSAGNVYLTGTTFSTDFPTANPFQPGRSGPSDAFVLKLDIANNRIVYASYLGGSSFDNGRRISVDTAGNSYIMGDTESTNFPTASPLQPANGGGRDCFLAKIGPAGNTLLYSTYLGGNDTELAGGHLLGPEGTVYFSMTSNSSNLPTVNPFQAARRGPSDLYIGRLNASGSQLLGATYLGGTSSESAGFSMTTDSSGNLVVVGSTLSSDFPVLNPIRPPSGLLDGFITILAGDLRSLVFSTHYGGSASDGFTGAVVDPSTGKIYVTGSTLSLDFPTVNPIQPYGGGADIVVVGLDLTVSPAASKAASRVSFSITAGAFFSTFFGVSGDERPSSIVSLGKDKVGLSGSTTSENILQIDTLGRACSSGTSGSGSPNPGSFVTVFDTSTGEIPFSACMGTGVFNAIMDNIGPGKLVVVSNDSNGNMSVEVTVLQESPPTPLPGPLAGADLGGNGIFENPWSAWAPQPGGSPANFVFIATYDTTPQVTGGEPVMTATGEFFDTTVDLELGGPFPLLFGRYYGALLGAAAEARGFYGKSDNPMGTNWVHNFHILLRRVDATNLRVSYYRGATIWFRKSGSAWSMAQPSGGVFRGMPYQMIEPGGKFKFIDPDLEKVFTFDGAGLTDGTVRPVESIADRNGNTHTLGYNADGTLKTVSDGAGRTLEFSYVMSAGKPRVSKVADQTGRAIQFGYSGALLGSSTDANNKVTTYTTSAAGLLESIATPDARTPVRNTWASDAPRVVSQLDGAGAVTRFTYNATSTVIADALNQPVTHQFNSDKRLVGYTDQTGKNVQFSYDSALRRTATVDRFGDTSGVAYHAASGRVASRTDALGKTWRYSYASQASDGVTFFNLTRIDFPDGAFETFVYDARGNPTSRTDRAGKTWTFTYNARGQLLTSNNPDNGVMNYSYNTDGTLASVRDAAGNTSTFSYDALKRPERITLADGATVRTTYDSKGNMLSRVDELNRTTRYTYDESDRLRTLTTPLDRTWTLAYDGAGRLTSVTDPAAKSTTVTYDALGRMVTRTDRNGNTWTYQYDARSRLVGLRDPAGKNTAMAYDEEGVPSSLTDRLGQTWSFGSDKLGRTTSLVDPLANQSRLGYDAFSRVTSATNPLNEVSTYTYEARGLLARAAMPESVEGSYTRNNLGLITEITDPRGKKRRYVYDSSGRTTSATDPIGAVTSYQYDARNRFSRTEHPLGSLVLTYDAAGAVTDLGYSDGTRLNFAYDGAGRMVTATGAALDYDDHDRIISSNGITVARDAGNRITSLVLEPGKTITYTYDSRNLLTTVADWAGATTTFSYDDGGRLVSTTRLNGVVTTYTYDAASRLTGIAENRGAAALSSIALGRNGAARITQATRTLPLGPSAQTGTRNAAFNDADQIVGSTYDSRGRLTSGSGRSYAWNLASRLTSYTEGQSTALFTYDAFGHRLTRAVGSATRGFVWNYALGLPSVSIIRDNSITTRYYVHTPGGSLLYSIEAAGNARRYYHFDEVGSTIFLTDDAGAITDRYSYSPYGEVLESSGGTDNPFQFVGRYGVEREPSTGLYYMRARYYDSLTARFVSRDPLGPQIDRTGTLNPYQYAAQDPLGRIDPLGLEDDKWTDPFISFDAEGSVAPLFFPRRTQPAAEPSADGELFLKTWAAEQRQRWAAEQREREKRKKATATSTTSKLTAGNDLSIEQVSSQPGWQQGIGFWQSVLTAGNDLSIGQVSSQPGRPGPACINPDRQCDQPGPPAPCQQGIGLDSPCDYSSQTRRQGKPDPADPNMGLPTPTYHYGYGY